MPRIPTQAGEALARLAGKYLPDTAKRWYEAAVPAIRSLRVGHVPKVDPQLVDKADLLKELLNQSPATRRSLDYIAVRHRPGAAGAWYSGGRDWETGEAIGNTITIDPSLLKGDPSVFAETLGHEFKHARRGLNPLRMLGWNERLRTGKYDAWRDPEEMQAHAAGFGFGFGRGQQPPVFPRDVLEENAFANQVAPGKRLLDFAQGRDDASRALRDDYDIDLTGREWLKGSPQEQQVYIRQQARERQAQPFQPSLGLRGGHGGQTVDPKTVQQWEWEDELLQRHIADLNVMGSDVVPRPTGAGWLASQLNTPTVKEREPLMQAYRTGLRRLRRFNEGEFFEQLRDFGANPDADPRQNLFEVLQHLVNRGIDPFPIMRRIIERGQALEGMPAKLPTAEERLYRKALREALKSRSLNGPPGDPFEEVLPQGLDWDKISGAWGRK